MDFKRIFSGFIVGLAILVILIMPNQFITEILFTIITIIAMHEYLNAISKVCNPVKWVAYISCLIVAIINYIPNQYINLVLMGSLPIILLLLFSQVIATDMKTRFKDMAYTFLGICYIPGFLVNLSLINNMENGKIVLGYVFIAASITDTLAYCVGKRFGKHKFSKVSPKKSIEGCIGGTLSAIIVALIYTFILNKYFSFNYSYLVIGILALILSLIGQIGDFSASCIKRYVDIKDYGNLLPGHGGILDRIDSVLFIAPFAYILFMMI